VGGEGIGSGHQKPVLGQYLAGSTGIGKSWLACALGHKALYGAFDVKVLVRAS
jgi:DNA replication protein DnaC